jgi:hypothetical protein
MLMLKFLHECEWQAITAGITRGMEEYTEASKDSNYKCRPIS